MWSKYTEFPPCRWRQCILWFHDPDHRQLGWWKWTPFPWNCTHRSKYRQIVYLQRSYTLQSGASSFTFWSCQLMGCKWWTEYQIMSKTLRLIFFNLICLFLLSCFMKRCYCCWSLRIWDWETYCTRHKFHHLTACICIQASQCLLKWWCYFRGSPPKIWLAQFELSIVGQASCLSISKCFPFGSLWLCTGL